MRIICDNCEEAFDTGLHKPGEKMPCPFCGDINRIPGEPAAAPEPAPHVQARNDQEAKQPAQDAAGEAPRPRSAAAPSPSAPERELLVVRQGMFRAHPFWYLLMVLLFVAGVALAIAAVPMQAVADWLAWGGLAMAGVAFLWWFIWWIAPHRWVKLIITSKRTIRQEGIVMRKTSEVLHKHVTNVTISQGFIDRMLDVGYIAIDSAGQGGEPMRGEDGAQVRRSDIEIEVEHIPHPYEIKRLIDEHRGL
jgi:hypothetical protein